MLCTASILNLSFISLDRYYAVCHPLLYRKKISVNVVVIMILLSWSISAFIGFGMIFLKLNIWGIEDFYYNHIACEGRCVLFQTGMSSVVSSVLSFYIPGIIMLGVYLKIFLVAQRQLRSIQNKSCMSSTRTSKTNQTKATKTLAIIMGAFLSFWTPFFVCNITDPFIGYSTSPALFETLVWVGYLNSTVNPIIYAFFYSWFRKAFRLFTSDKTHNGITKPRPFEPDSYWLLQAMTWTVPVQGSCGCSHEGEGMLGLKLWRPAIISQGGGQTVGRVVGFAHNVGCRAPAPADINVLSGREAAASDLLAFTTLCSAFLSAAEQFPCQVVMEKVSVVYHTPVESCQHWGVEASLPYPPEKI
ncbi:trace amine-associated receptor 1-like [Symphorus nematophorus]